MVRVKAGPQTDKIIGAGSLYIPTRLSIAEGARTESDGVGGYG